jgi:signal transduction histidine kinase
MLLLAAVGSSVFALSTFLAAERLEQSVLNRHIAAEFERFAAQASQDPGLEASRSALLTGYVGRENPALPDEFKDLATGSYHAVHVGDKAFQVYVDDMAGERLFVAYDITEWEALEQPVIYILISGIIFSCVLAVVLGFWVSAQVIAPVTAVSKRLKQIDPRQRKVRIAHEFSGAEVSSIAEAFDRYMERLDGFVERERLFTSAAAHELRTPVAVIQGATDVLADQPDLPPAAQRATARLQRASRDMRELIDALLFLSREDRDNDFSRSQSEISAIVRHLADDYEHAMASKGLALKLGHLDELWLEIPPALPTIVISNLLRNAIEHTEAGTIRVALRDRQLSIEDTGKGIPDSAQASLFDLEYSTKPFGGGMGLHLTKRICDRFGWALAIASTTGIGTSVSIRF